MKTLTLTLAFLFGVLSLAANLQGAQLFKLPEVVGMNFILRCDLLDR
jgi:hypothetical protein